MRDPGSNRDGVHHSTDPGQLAYPRGLTHPWELDPDQPRVGVPWPTRIRHYGGLGKVRARIERLLRDFAFMPIRDSLGLL
jgi:hypothetical protein